jgi:hypothetical protein
MVERWKLTIVAKQKYCTALLLKKQVLKFGFLLYCFRAPFRAAVVVSTGPALPETSPLVARAAHLPPYQKRVIDEKRELDERKEKLEAFFDTPTFAQLDADEQGRLHAQRGAMAAYSRILCVRIAGFGASENPV